VEHLQTAIAQAARASAAGAARHHLLNAPIIQEKALRPRRWKRHRGVSGRASLAGFILDSGHGQPQAAIATAGACRGLKKVRFFVEDPTGGNQPAGSLSIS
jgi:hypothetical protein